MMEGLLNIVRREAQIVAERAAGGIRIGTVTSYDPATHSVKLALQPEGTQTGWMPLTAAGVGSGFGVYVGATDGQAFAAFFHEGDIEAGIIIGRLPTDQEPPISVQSGEVVIQSPTGSLVSLLKDGTVTVQDKGGGKIAFDGAGNITMAGKAGQSIAMDASGNITLTPSGGGKVQLGGATVLPVAVYSGGSTIPATKVTAV